MANSGMLSNPASDWIDILKSQKAILAWQKILENKEPFVDLGLSVKWGRCNLGADSPEEYGDYYAWGEIKTKREYTQENSLTNKRYSIFKKEWPDIAGNPKYDAATAQCENGVRLPTKKEIDELIKSTRYIWTECNGVKGYIVISDINGNSIFLPAAGRRDGTSLNYAGGGCDYWSSTPKEDGGYYAYSLGFSSGYFCSNCRYRGSGYSVRPVRE